MRARLAAAVLPLLAGCTTIHADQRTFESTRWHVAQLGSEPTGQAHAYYMIFHKGRVSGRFGCNYFGARYSASGETMTVTEVNATRMACDGPARIHERIGFDTLAQPMGMAWSGDQVTLSNARGSIGLERLP